MKESPYPRMHLSQRPVSQRYVMAPLWSVCTLNPSSSGSRIIRGFSLIELSIVLIVVGLLTSAALGPLGLAIERSRERTTQRLLDAAREALIGHVIATGVLPCPSSTSGSAAFPNQAAPVPSAPGRPLPDDPGGIDRVYCRSGFGFLPNRVLGLSAPVDATGIPIDAWGNRLRYSVSLHSHGELGNPAAPDWTTPGELASVGLANVQADLSLCDETASSGCPRRALRAGQIVAVIWSAGADASAAGIQAENLDDDTVFAVTGYSQVAGSPFDDQMLWLSRSELGYWLLRANWLD